MQEYLLTGTTLAPAPIQFLVLNEGFCLPFIFFYVSFDWLPFNTSQFMMCFYWIKMRVTKSFTIFTTSHIFSSFVRLYNLVGGLAATSLVPSYLHQFTVDFYYPIFIVDVTGIIDRMIKGFFNLVMNNSILPYTYHSPISLFMPVVYCLYLLQNNLTR